MRAFQRTSNHDRTTDQTFFIDKSFNPPPFRRSLDAGSLFESLIFEKSKNKKTLDDSENSRKESLIDSLIQHSRLRLDEWDEC